MSTQLIVYPQTYNGTYNSTWVATTPEFVSDGVNFSGINGSGIFQTFNTMDAHLYVTPPAAPNTWYRWRRTISTPAYPAQTGGNLVLNAVGPISYIGVYQKLSTLTVGAVYLLTVNVTGIFHGALSLKAFNLNTNSLIASANVTSNTTQQTLSFTAQTPNDTISIVYWNITASNLTISSISIVNQATVGSGVYTDLNDGQVICDLYEEEDIPLTLSIDDFKNVAEQVKSYSKDFNLPATKRNNRIFNNMFEVTRADDGLIFNPYVKTKCVLKQDGFILFEGWLRMINVKDDKGEISYNVNLYSEVVALADTLKELTFATLDFSELKHLYNKSVIKNSWYNTTGLLLENTITSASFAYDTTGVIASPSNHTNVLKYPFIDWTHQYIVGGTNVPSTSATIGNPELTSLEQAFRPCIQLKYLINRIFEQTAFTWTSNFFDSTGFEKLFMDFNWGGDVVPITINTTGLGQPLLEQIGTPSFVTILSDNNNFPLEIGYSAGVYTALVDGQTYIMDWAYLYSTSGAVAFTAEFRWKLVLGGVTSYFYLAPVSGTGTSFAVSAGNFTQVLNTGDTLTPEFKSATAATNPFTLHGMNSVIGTSSTTVITSATASTTDTILQTLRGELGQWDFLKGIMTMFNLVSMVNPDKENDILIEPYADVFVNITKGTKLAARSIQHDWTTKVDVSQMELKPLTDLNKITNFKFVEDEDDYVFRQYKNSTSGHLYGSLDYIAATSSQNLPTMLVGKKEIIAEPFAATVSKPIDDQFSSFVIPSIYAMNDDGTSEGFDNSPRIFYNNGVKSTGASFYIPSQNGYSSENQTDFLQFSHLSAIPATAGDSDFVFASEQLFPGVGVPPIDNLYQVYWSPYFNELYNADTRFMTLKVNLTPADINTFKFYDMVFIKNRAFRVNKIEYKPNELATVEFILIP